MRDGLQAYIEAEIIPRYRHFDKAHQEGHARSVIAQALDLSRYYDVDPDLVYTAAAYHDTGLAVDRATHHLESGKIIRSDARLREWFTQVEIETAAQAAEDHRASAKEPPRSSLGAIVAEADRDVEPETIVRRTVEYSLSHFPNYDREQHWQRCLDHLHEKYAEGGYIKLWLPDSPNAAPLAELRTLIKNETKLRDLFDTLLKPETLNSKL
jgi:uncharacterized protein